MNQRNPVILCVDDEEANRKLLEHILVPRGYAVVSAASGKDALLKIKSQAIDLVLLDVIMPGMDGFEACRQIKEDQKLRDIPVILVTALSAKQDHIRGIEAGADEFLSKPIEKTMALARIKILLKVKELNDERKRAESQREAALEALQKAHDELDRKVRERTAELAQANEMLKADIIKREQIEETLRKSEENFRLSLEDSPLGVRIATAKGETILANKALLDIYGHVNIEELNAIPLKERYTPQSYAEFQMRKKDRERDDFGPSQYEINIVRKNGEIRNLYAFRKEIIWNGTKQFQVIYQDITERKRAEFQKEAALVALRESEGIFKQFLAASPVLVYIKNEEHRFNKLSKSFEDLFGKPISELIGKDLYDLLPPELAKIVYEDDQKVLRGGVSVSAEERLNDRVFSSIKFPIHRESGNPDYLGGFSVDITERKHAEELIRASLQEKEVLLQEIHHRVKNNLQIISGLLTLQADQTAGKSLDDIFRASQDRIRSMALIHEKLYSSHNLAEIAFDEYLRTLTENLFASQGIVAGRISVKYELEPLLCAIEKAIPLGLIANELVTNALKHAFPAGQQGEIRVILQECRGVKFYAPTDENHFPTCELIIADNGVGLPAGFKPDRQKSLGMNLLSMLAQQIQAELKVKTGPGTEFRLIFPGLPANAAGKDKLQ